MSRAVRALSKSASHRPIAVSVAEASTVRAVLVCVMEALQMVGGWRFGVQPECGQYLTGQTPGQKHITWSKAVPIQRRPRTTAYCHVFAILHVSACAVTSVFC